MFRRVEDMKGGPDDPRDVSEWWASSGKNVIVPLAILIGFILLVGLIFGH